MRDDPTVVALVTRARDRDKAAWDEIVERYAPLVWSICAAHRLGRADADDVAQTVWLTLVERLADLRDPAALPGWLAAATRRECAERARTSGAEPPDPAAIDRAVRAATRNAALTEAFRGLDPGCRRLLALLMERPSLSHAEIGAALGLPAEEIGPARARCLERLRGSPALTGSVSQDGGERDGVVGR
ncbi:RNA polymerase sigma factor [Actinomadura rubrisoli]|uniref:Sigma-70 family RNA polymerase sigma factor n=1 Tax=Actinomadura rubrisoli TaxID=2530368 RepID=A0A4R5B0N8_9ACTN|nr:sigma-70 family RNA polymerase sigma factor [Actinomadura rubrisoli]TDD79528.1 sigma-70 family RNA polymerase sigma factor [Actinomadura rubrisoli]